MTVLDRIRRVLDRETRAAERRWTARNAEARARGCYCGGPAEAVRVDGGNVGAVPVEFWSCRAHAAVPLDAWWRNGTPPNARQRCACGWRRDSYDDGVTWAGMGGPIAEERHAHVWGETLRFGVPA